MCGLQGFSGKGPYSLDKMKFLMFWNSIKRGMDATGIFTPLSGILKDNDSADVFFTGKEIKKLKEDNVFIGHVRAKTIGHNSAANAHPFEFGNIVLAHNGTLEKYIALATKYDMDHRTYNVDSQVLAYAISKNFEQNANGDLSVLSEYQGAAALLFYNKDTENLYAFHDKNRPLFYGWDQYGNMYISSIKESLESADCFSVQEFEINTLYTIKDSQIIDKKVYQTYAELNPVVEKKDTKTKFKETALKYPELRVNQTGFTKRELKPHYALGMWLRAKYSSIGGTGTKEKMANISKDKFYYVTAFYEDHLPYVQIIDDNYDYGQVSLHALDHESFIPTTDSFVVMTSNVVATKSQETLWLKGEMVLLEDFNLEENLGILYCEYLKKSFTVNSKFFRPTIPSDFDAPFIESKKLPVTTKADKVQEELFPEPKEEEVKDTPDEFVDMRLYTGLTDRVKKELDLLEGNYNDNKDISPDINQIRATLNLSLDAQYMDTFKTEI